MTGRVLTAYSENTSCALNAVSDRLIEENATRTLSYDQVLVFGGAYRIRTGDLYNANVARY